MPQSTAVDPRTGAVGTVIVASGVEDVIANAMAAIQIAAVVQLQVPQPILVLEHQTIGSEIIHRLRLRTTR